MKVKTKIVLIGAGSREFSQRLIHDLMLEQELAGSRELEMALVDLNAEALKHILAYARRCAELSGVPIRFSATTERAEALPGADFVLLSVAVRRMELWEQDFRIPLAFGVRHIYGENGGPGALFHALRNLKIILPICRDIERLCPEALLLNFTNPEARILTAILTLTRLNALGLCHGFHSFQRLASAVLGRDLGELDIRTAGMNHFYTFYRIADRASGRDLRLEFERRLRDKPELLPPLVRYIWETFGVLGYIADHHLGEYLGYAHEFTGLRWLFGIESREVLPEGAPADANTAFDAWRHHLEVRSYLASGLEQKEKELLEGRAPLDAGTLTPSGEMAVPIIADMLLDRKILRPAVNLLNREGWIENLARDGCIEVPAVVDRQGVHPDAVGSLPEGFAAQIRLQHSIMKLLVQAVASKSKGLLLQALLLDPTVHSAKNAERMLELMLQLQREYLPEFRR